MKDSGQIIGFASQFYTLWNWRVVTNYVTDSYGKSRPSYNSTYFDYVKNVSKSLEKVNELFPDLNIDEGLRGKTRSFIIHDKQIDLSPELIKFGKYYGKTIQEISDLDFDYLLWLRGNVNNPQTRTLIDQLPSIVSYDAQIEADILSKIDKIRKSLLKAGTYSVVFERNPRNYMYDVYNTYYIKWNNTEWEDVIKSDYLVGDVYIGDVIYTLVFQGYKEVNGRYPYVMPEINGKCKRVKGKEVEIEVLPLGYTYIATEYENEPYRQLLLVK